MKESKRLKTTSLKTKLIILNAIVFALVVCVAAVCALSNSTLFTGYNRMSQNYNLLFDFYDASKNSYESIQAHLYYEAGDNYEQYKGYNAGALRALEKLTGNFANSGVSWEIEKLKNMQLTFDEKVTELMLLRPAGGIIFAQKYDYLVRLNELIQNTVVSYFELLNDQMNIQQENMREYWQVMIKLITILLLFIVLLEVVFTFVATHSITTPISRIVQNIQLVKQGKYDLKYVKNTSRELAVLCDAFDDMAHSVQNHVTSVQEKAHLEKQLLEKENENLRMNELLIETELKVLQGQINPHFLFNTLNMISKVAYMENAAKTSQLMEATSDLLRYSLDKSNKTSDLEGELGSVENYIYIQRLRFGDRVEFALNIDSDLPNVRIPGMIVQPLIENAVMHGISDLVSGACISVSAFKKDGFVMITVDDNGKGMSEERINDVLASQTSIVSSISNRSGIGVYNVKRRLEVFFGKNHKFFIESSPGCGSCVTIAVPI